MSRYYKNYDQYTGERLSILPCEPPRPFNYEAFNRLLDLAAQAGGEYGDRVGVQAKAARAAEADRGGD